MSVRFGVHDIFKSWASLVQLNASLLDDSRLVLLTFDLHHAHRLTLQLPGKFWLLIILWPPHISLGISNENLVLDKDENLYLVRLSILIGYLLDYVGIIRERLHVDQLLELKC